MPATPSAGQRPNIVFILLDNIGLGTFGVYGGTIPSSVGLGRSFL